MERPGESLPMNLSSSMACCEEDGEVLGSSARSPTERSKACLLISRGAIVKHHIEAYGASLSDAAGAGNPGDILYIQYAPPSSVKVAIAFFV